MRAYLPVCVWCQHFSVLMNQSERGQRSRCLGFKVLAVCVHVCVQAIMCVLECRPICVSVSMRVLGEDRHADGVNL